MMMMNDVNQICKEMTVRYMDVGQIELFSVIDRPKCPQVNMRLYFCF